MMEKTILLFVSMLSLVNRLFLVSSKFSAELPSDTCTRTAIINFSATLEGYQDQLLSATINIVCVMCSLLERKGGAGLSLVPFLLVWHQQMNTQWDKGIYIREGTCISIFWCC